jgi:hypothetical protein
MSSSREKLKRVGVCAHTTGYKRRNSGASIYRSIPRHPWPARFSFQTVLK